MHSPSIWPSICHISRPTFTPSSLLPLNSARSTANTVPRLERGHRAKRPVIENLNGGTVSKNHADGAWRWRSIQFLILRLWHGFSLIPYWDSLRQVVCSLKDFKDLFVFGKRVKDC